MDAVLGPRLREGFEFDVAWLTPTPTKVCLHSLHLVQAQEEVRFAREFLQGLVIEIEQRDRAGLDVPLVSGRERFGMERDLMYIVNERVGEASLGEGPGLGLVQSDHVESPSGPHRDLDAEQAADTQFDRLCIGIHDTRLGVDFHQGIGPGIGGSDDGMLRDGMAQQFVGDSMDIGVVQFTFDQVDGRGMDDLRLRIKRRCAGRLAGGGTAWISSFTAGTNLDAVDRHGGLHPGKHGEYRSGVDSATACRLVTTLDGQLITPLVLRMVIVTTDPVRRDLVDSTQLVQHFPEIPVQHRFLL